MKALRFERDYPRFAAARIAAEPQAALDAQAGLIVHVSGAHIAGDVAAALRDGTAARVAAGEPVDIIPADLTFKLDDRLVVVHSFSKSFLMTGWRLGWLVLPPSVTPQIGKLIEFNSSCAPVFVQRAGVAAMGGAASFVPGLVERLRGCRDRLLPQLAALRGPAPLPRDLEGVVGVPGPDPLRGRGAGAQVEPEPDRAHFDVVLP